MVNKDLLHIIKSEITTIKSQMNKQNNIPWVSWYCFMLQVEKLIEDIES